MQWPKEKRKRPNNDIHVWERYNTRMVLNNKIQCWNYFINEEHYFSLFFPSSFKIWFVLSFSNDISPQRCFSNTQVKESKK